MWMFAFIRVHSRRFLVGPNPSAAGNGYGPFAPAPARDYVSDAMNDIIRKTLLAGVGAAVVTREKVESALGDFVRQGKVSSAEAREMAGRIADEGRREFETLKGDLEERLRGAFDGVDERAHHRIDALEARVAALEHAAAGAEGRAADELGAPERD